MCVLCVCFVCLNVCKQKENIYVYVCCQLMQGLQSSTGLYINPGGIAAKVQSTNLGAIISPPPLFLTCFSPTGKK